MTSTLATQTGERIPVGDAAGGIDTKHGATDLGITEDDFNACVNGFLAGS